MSRWRSTKASRVFVALQRIGSSTGRSSAIDGLPEHDQDALIRTIDAFLQARKAS